MKPENKTIGKFWNGSGEFCIGQVKHEFSSFQDTDFQPALLAPVIFLLIAGRVAGSGPGSSPL